MIKAGEFFKKTFVFGLRSSERAAAKPYVRGQADLVSYSLQEGVRLDVYWVEEGGDRGPAASLFAHGFEVMRLDCFGGKNGHYHINVLQAFSDSRGNSTRLFFPEGTVTEHIHRAAFELRANSRYALVTHRNDKVHSTRLDPAAVDRAASFAEYEMSELAKKRGFA